MIESLLLKIFSSANFNRLMTILAVEGGTYLFTKEWEGWSKLTAIIFAIIGYVVITFICYLWNKRPRKDKYYKENRQRKENWFKQLSTDKKKILLQIINNDNLIEYKDHYQVDFKFDQYSPYQKQIDKIKKSVDLLSDDGFEYPEDYLTYHYVDHTYTLKFPKQLVKQLKEYEKTLAHGINSTLKIHS